MVLFHRHEVPLAVAHSPDVRIYQANADTVGVISQREQYFPRITSQFTIGQCSALLKWHWRHMHLVFWAAEYKQQASGCNQLMYDLSSAQWQRRLLGSAKDCIFGAATISNPLTITVFASFWNSDVDTVSIIMRIYSLRFWLTRRYKDIHSATGNV